MADCEGVYRLISLLTENQRIPHGIWIPFFLGLFLERRISPMKEYSHGSGQKITLSSTPPVASFSCTMNHYTMVQTAWHWLHFQLPYQESVPVGGSEGSTCHSPSPPPTPHQKNWNPSEQKMVNIISVHVINKRKCLETGFYIVHDLPMCCLSPLYHPNYQKR